MVSPAETQHKIELVQIILCVSLIVVGIIGSIISMKVFSSRKMKKCSTNTYLILLSAVDAGYLFVILVDEMMPLIVDSFHITVPLNIVDQETLLCKTVNFIRHDLRCVASWIIVAFTSERLITIYWPRQQAIIGAKRHATKVVFYILSGSSLLSIYSLLGVTLVPTLEPLRMQCDVPARNHRIYYHLTVFYTLFAMWLPMILIFIGNMLIIHRIRIASTRLKVLRMQSELIEATVDSVRTEAMQDIMKTDFENSRITWILALITTSLVFNIPYFTVWNIAYILKNRGGSGDYIPLNEARSFTIVLHTFNYSSHFFLFFISRRNYRKVLYQKLKCVCVLR